MEVQEVRKEKEKFIKDMQKLCFYFYEKTGIDVIKLKVIRVPIINDDELGKYSVDLTLEGI